MIDRSYEAACSGYRDALRIAETGCVSAVELADTLEGLSAIQLQFDADAGVDDLLDRAETARQHVLDSTIARCGKDHLETAEAYYRFAFHNVIRRCPAKAISYFQETLAIKEAVFGVLQFEVANTLMIMGGIHPEESEKTALWHRAVDILQHLFDNPDKSDTDSVKHVPTSLRGALENLAAQAFHDDRLVDSEDYFRRAMATCSVAGGKQSCLCNAPTFGKVLLALKKHDECEAFLSNAIADGGGGFRKRKCSEVLADLYNETGRPNEAQAMRNPE